MGSPTHTVHRVNRVPPVCSNCGASDFVWANDLKTGGLGGGSLSLRARGELSLGTRICRACGHADLFLKDPSILRMPHTWKPGEFTPIAPRPAAPAAHHAAHPAATPAPAPAPAPSPATPAPVPAPAPSPFAPAPSTPQVPPAPPPPQEPAAVTPPPPPPPATAEPPAEASNPPVEPTKKATRKRSTKSKANEPPAPPA